MTKAKRYDTVVFLEPIGVFQKGEKGAVVEVYTLCEAYDIEIVTDEDKTKGIAEGVRPEQIRVSPQVRFASIRVSVRSGLTSLGKAAMPERCFLDR